MKLKPFEKDRRKMKQIQFRSFRFHLFYSILFRLLCYKKFHCYIDDDNFAGYGTFVRSFCFVYFLINNLLRLKIDLKMCKMCIVVEIFVFIKLLVGIKSIWSWWKLPNRNSIACAVSFVQFCFSFVCWNYLLEINMQCIYDEYECK